jgi:Protein of unknown function (DUF998)
MLTSPEDTFVRPTDLSDLSDSKVLYARSYLLIRTVVGVIGILLPLVFIVGEAFFLRAGVHVRGSISAYYHTSMRDVFVGGLCVVGLLLVTYMAEQRKRPDWWLSLIAGIAVLGVVFFPTGRPSLPDEAPLCGSTPEPAGCSPVQQWLGEELVATIHFVCAVVFILSLAGICFYFAYRERTAGNAGAAWFQRACGGVIVAAVMWAIIGGFMEWDLGELTPLYVGEVASIWAFGASWLTGSRDLWRLMFPALARPAASTAQPAAG